MAILWTRRQCFAALAGAIPAVYDGRRLTEQWRHIASTTDGMVGAAALHFSSGALVSLHGEDRFPLASVCKVPIAANILALVDEGKLTRDEQIEVLPRDVWAGVSDLEKRWPAQRHFKLDEMIELMVAESDNTAVETLFRIGGQAQAMAARLQQWQIDGIRIDRSERQCSLDRNGVAHFPPASEWTDQRLEALTKKVSPTERYRATLRYLADPRDTGTPIGTNPDVGATISRQSAFQAVH